MRGSQLWLTVVVALATAPADLLGQEQVTISALSSLSTIENSIGDNTAAEVGGEFRVEYTPGRFGYGLGVDVTTNDVDTIVGGEDLKTISIFGTVTRHFGHSQGVQPYVQGRVGWKRLYADDTPFTKDSSLGFEPPTGDFDQSGAELGLATGLQVPLIGKFRLETSAVFTLLFMATPEVDDVKEPILSADEAVRIGLRLGFAVSP